MTKILTYQEILDNTESAQAIIIRSKINWLNKLQRDILSNYQSLVEYGTINETNYKAFQQENENLIANIKNTQETLYNILNQFLNKNP